MGCLDHLNGESWCLACYLGVTKPKPKPAPPPLPKYVIDQPPPLPQTNAPSAWSLVIRDMIDRDLAGTKKYGTRLHAGDGRDSLRDAYEEALDLAVYLRNEIAKRENAAGTKP